MSGRFSLAAPPASGKMSRREKASRSGRSVSFDTDELAQLSHTPRSQASPFPVIDESNPFASDAGATRRASPSVGSNASATPTSAGGAAASSFFGSAPTAAAPTPDDLFSFFDPLADKPAARPAPQPPARPTRSAASPQPPTQQQPQSDPFSDAFSSQLRVADPFDPFTSAAAPAPVQQPARAPAAKKAAPPADSSSDEESEEESSESEESSDSDSSSDDDEGQPPKVKKVAAAKAAPQLPARPAARLSSGPAASGSVAATGNRSIASGSPASVTAATGVAGGRRGSILKVDVLAFMRRGTPFLKYGKSGYPHFRQFQLSEDSSRVIWFSQNKRQRDTQIDLYTVDSLRLGQTTSNFARHPAPDLDASSFSLIYDNGRSSLDVIAKDPNEYKIWTAGLAALLKLCEEGPGRLERLQTLPLDLGIQSSRRSSVDIVDVRTGQTALEAAGQQDDAAQRPRAISTNNKHMYKEVAKSFANLKYKLNKRRDELREHRLYTTPQYEAMQDIVKKVQDSINKIQDLFQDGEYPMCDDEIWRAGVDLESLKNMMRAVRPM